MRGPLPSIIKTTPDEEEQRERTHVPHCRHTAPKGRPIREVKKPRRKDGIEQLKSYCNAEGSPIAVWTNGGEVVAMHRVDPNLYRALSDLPNVHQTLEAITAERVTLAE